MVHKDNHHHKTENRSRPKLPLSPKLTNESTSDTPSSEIDSNKALNETNVLNYNVTTTHSYNATTTDPAASNLAKENRTPFVPGIAFIAKSIDK